MATDVCPICEGTGLHVVTSKRGDRFAQECGCQLQLRVNRKLDRAGVPARFRGKSLESYRVEGRHASVYAAKDFAKRFVDTYPYGMKGLGLVLVGSSGLGKTHLAASMLQALIVEKQVRGLFFDYQELLKLIQNSYNPSVAATEMGVLQPVFDAEVLVLDDLGSTRPTDWVWDTVSHIVNSRYNRDRTTIITTNFPDAPAVWGEAALQPAGALAAMRRGETLGDRIGERMRSRLHEMCEFLVLEGDDLRQGEYKARFRPM